MKGRHTTLQSLKLSSLFFFLRCLGNVMPVSREPLQITFYPFRENRLSAIVRVTDTSQPPTCRLAFLKEPRKDRLGNVRPICNLSIDLSEEVSAFERKNKIQVHSISRKAVNLSVVCVGDLIFFFFFFFLLFILFDAELEERWSFSSTSW